MTFPSAGRDLIRWTTQISITRQSGCVCQADYAIDDWRSAEEEFSKTTTDGSHLSLSLSWSLGHARSLGGIRDLPSFLAA